MLSFFCLDSQYSIFCTILKTEFKIRFDNTDTFTIYFDKSFMLKTEADTKNEF